MPEKTSQKEKEKVSETVKNQFHRIEYTRDTKRGVLGGVIAGLADYTGWDLTLLRVLFVLLMIFTAFVPFAIAYLVVWICAPDEPSTAARTKKSAGKTTDAERAVVDGDTAPGTRGATNGAQSTVSLVIRIVMMICGIIGFCIYVPILVALVPVSILSIIGITSATIVQPPLFIATAILVGLTLFLFVATGLHFSTALVTARLSRRGVISMIINVVLIIVLGTAATTTGALWLHAVGREGAEATWNSISEDVKIDIDATVDGHDTINIDLGPVHIHSK